MLNKGNVAKFEKKLLKALNELVGNSQKEIKMREKNSKCYEFKGTPKEFKNYLEDKYG